MREFRRHEPWRSCPEERQSMRPDSALECMEGGPSKRGQAVGHWMDAGEPEEFPTGIVRIFEQGLCSIYLAVSPDLAMTRDGHFDPHSDAVLPPPPRPVPGSKGVSANSLPSSRRRNRFCPAISDFCRDHGPSATETSPLVGRDAHPKGRGNDRARDLRQRKSYRGEATDFWAARRTPPGHCRRGRENKYRRRSRGRRRDRWGHSCP